jgi:Glucodextranase, domain B
MSNRIQCRHMLALLLVVCGYSTETLAQSCGVVPQNIGKLFASGFEFGETRPLLSPESQTLGLIVTAPADGSTTGQESIQVLGTFTGPPNTGISVNKSAAALAISSSAAVAKSFVANEVLVEGINTITIVVTAENGQTQTTTRTVTYAPATAPLAELKTETNSYYAAMRMPFRPQAGLGKVVQSMAIDYTSNGSVDQTGSASVNFVGVYSEPGNYLATAQITVADIGGANPQVITATRRVVAENKQVVRYTLCRIYERVRADLQAQQITSALTYLSSDIRPRFQTLWTAILPQLPSYAPQLGTIVSGVIGSDIAAYTLHKDDGLNRVQVFSVQFSKSASGVWRISNW